MGDLGKTGPMGPAYSSWLTRHVLLAYLILCLGFIVSLAFTITKFDSVTAEIQRVALSNCVAGNERTLVQAAQLREGLRQNESLDLGRLLDIDEGRVAEIRAISRRNVEQRLAQLPYVDCQTGEHVPLPPP